jgi:hypothetical protein
VNPYACVIILTDREGYLWEVATGATTLPFSE